MALQSKLFRGDAKLEATAISDPAHVLLGASGPHVGKIQLALIQLSGAAITQDSAYGPATAAAVREFKQRRRILNTQGKVDDIVGKKTIAALDTEMFAKEKGGSGASGVRLGFKVAGTGTGAAGGVTLIDQPPGAALFPLTILPDNDGQGGRKLKSDLDSATRQLQTTSELAKIRVWAAKLGLGSALQDELQKTALSPLTLTSFLLRMLAAGKVEKAVFDEITFSDVRNFPSVDLGRRMSPRAVGLNETLLRNEMAVGGATALGMFSFWVSHGATPPPLKNFSTLDADTARAPSFIKAATSFESRLKENLREQFKLGLVDFQDLVTGPGPERVADSNIPAVEPGKKTQRLLPAIEPVLPDLGILTDTVVKICIGSFQGIRVSLSGFKTTQSIIPSLPSTFSGTLHYELRDHFGVDDDDCEVVARGIHGTPGQVAMWVLQHYAPLGHKPFIDQVLVRRDFSGNF